MAVDISSAALFWKDRLARVGHTGWSDPFIYAFDQLERLSYLRTKIEALGQSKGKALDFGCGTGDFSRLLLDLGYSVCGYDPYVDPRIRSPRFRAANTIEMIQDEPGSVDLVLSVTVLNHIMDNAQLDSVLSFIRSILKKREGRFLALEYAYEAGHVAGPSTYQRQMTLDQWMELFRSRGFVDLAVTQVPSPTFSPSTNYNWYAQRFAVKGLRRLGPWLPKSFRDLALHIVAVNALARPDLCDHRNSPLRLFECST